MSRSQILHSTCVKDQTVHFRIRCAVRRLRLGVALSVPE